MPIHDELLRVHERIDTIGVKMDAMIASVHAMNITMTEWVTLCKECRPKVVGNNGKASMDTRLDRLEQSKHDKDVWFWTIVGGITTAVSGGVSAAFAWFRS